MKPETRYTTDFAVFIMAHPNIITITSVPDVQNALLGHLNARDVTNARLAGIEGLHVQPTVRRRYLGARCDEILQNAICHNGPESRVRIQWCDQPRPTAHHPMGHNVCLDCRRSSAIDRSPLITTNLDRRHTVQCKKCSKKQRRLHPPPGPNGYEACDCREHINAGWKCDNCHDEVMALRTAPGFIRSDYLLRSHKVTDKRSKTKRKKIVQKDYPLRSREACATPNCCETPWMTPGFRRTPYRPISHPEATLMCLNCDGVLVYPVGSELRL